MRAFMIKYDKCINIISLNKLAHTDFLGTIVLRDALTHAPDVIMSLVCVTPDVHVSLAGKVTSVIKVMLIKLLFFVRTV